MRKRNTESTKHELGMRKERWIQMFNAYSAYVMFNTSPLNPGGTDSHTNSCKWNKRKKKFTEGHLRNEVWKCEIGGDDDSLEKVMSPNESSPWCNYTEKFKKQEYILIIPLDLWIWGVITATEILNNLIIAALLFFYHNCCVNSQLIHALK